MARDAKIDTLKVQVPATTVTLGEAIVCQHSSGNRYGVVSGISLDTPGFPKFKVKIDVEDYYRDHDDPKLRGLKEEESTNAQHLSQPWGGDAGAEGKAVRFITVKEGDEALKKLVAIGETTKPATEKEIRTGTSEPTDAGTVLDVTEKDNAAATTKPLSPPEVSDDKAVRKAEKHRRQQ